MHRARLSVRIGHEYRVVCWRRGRIAWTRRARNLVVNEGLTEILAKFYGGSSYTAAHYVGLKDAGTVAAGDTMASHAGWAELTNYDEAARPAFVPGTAAAQSIDSSASPATFTVASEDTVYGAFLSTGSTKGGTSDILIGAADFDTPADVEIEDLILVTIVATLTSS